MEIDDAYKLLQIYGSDDIVDLPEKETTIDIVLTDLTEPKTLSFISPDNNPLSTNVDTFDIYLDDAQYLNQVSGLIVHDSLSISSW